MEEKDKYYTPRLEDFLYGLEYEVRTKTGWHKCVFGQEFNDVMRPEEHWSAPFKELIKAESIRVKRLDKEDVEQLCTRLWQIPEDSFEFEFHIDFYDGNAGTVTFDDNNVVEDLYLFNTRLEAKNKSEFKKLMEQLNIK